MKITLENEKKLRDLETPEETEHRLKDFYALSKELYEPQKSALSYSIGRNIYESQKLNKTISQDTAQLQKIQDILSKLKYSLDIQDYIDCVTAMDKPLPPIKKFQEDLLNTQIILGYLENVLTNGEYLVVKSILQKYETKDE